MAKKGMKNWFGFGNKEADNNDEIETTEATQAADVENENQIEADVEQAEITASEEPAQPVTATDVEDLTAETEQEPEAEKPKWYQFGKKKQVAQQQADAEQKADPVAQDSPAIDNADTETKVDVSEQEVAIAEEITAETVVEATEVAPVVSAQESIAEIIEESAVAPAVEEIEQADEVVNTADEVDSHIEEQPKEKFFTRLKRGLSRTKGNIGSGFKGLFRGKHIDDELFEELEEQLLIADLGVATTTRIIDNLTQQASRKELKDADALYDILKSEMAGMLSKVDQPLEIDSNNKPHVILMVGVNGVGKTTTIGKMAKKFQAEGKSVMLAAGDTFRAAAVEQLQVWGERNDIPVVAQHTGADSASVLFDAMQSATAKDVDVLIADTAGRLQNKAHLMDELKKVVRVMKKHDATAPHEIMLTIDAGTGQNALSQAELFKEAVGLTGITLTKLDGTAKGGVIFAVADKFEIPIRFIGIGEGIDDLRTFNSEEFIDALFSHNDD